MKFELGLEGLIITSQAFIYTYMISGIVALHLTEQFGVEFNGTFGTSIDKDDKLTLEDDYSIKTQIIRISSMVGGNLLWTPIYGKYQLSSGRLIYFDTYLSGGMSNTGVEYQFDHCNIDKNSEYQLKSDYVASYPTFSVGIGQRFFVSKKSSFRWALKSHIFSTNSKDGACTDNPNIAETTTQQPNSTVHFGYSRFF